MSNINRGAELEEIWSLFAQEGKENLMLVEESLLKLEQEPENKSQIAALFRAMHSFKGGARMMGLSNVESLAHRAEDLLGLVRDKGVKLQVRMIDILLAVLDRQREMLDQVLKTGADVDPAAGQELIQTLSDLISECDVSSQPPAAAAPSQPAEPGQPAPAITVSPSGQAEPTSVAAGDSSAPPDRLTGPAAPDTASAPAAAPDLVEPVSAQGQTNPKDTLELAQAPLEAVPNSADQPTGASATAFPELDDALFPEPREESTGFAAFLETAQAELGALHSALDAFSASPEESGRLVHEVAIRLGQPANELGYGRLASALQDLERESAAAWRAETPAQELETRLVGFKRLELAIFEELTRVQESAAGSQPDSELKKQENWTNIAWLFRHWNADRVFGDLARLTGIADQLDALEREFTVDGGTAGQIERLADEAAVRLRAIHHSCIFYHLDAAVHLTLSLEDLYGRVAQGELLANAALTQLTRTYVTSLGSGLEAVQDGEPPAAGELEELIQQAQNFLYLSTDGPVYQVTRTILDVLDLPADFKEVMTPETLTEFSQALQEGRHFYTLLADLEREDAPSQAFFEWSHSPGVLLITNVTVYRYQRTLFNFLLATSLSHEEILGSLVKMDPQWQFLTLQECKLTEHARAQASAQPPQEAAPPAWDEVAPEPVDRLQSDSSSEAVEELIATVGRMVAEGSTLSRVTDRLAKVSPAEEIVRVVREAGGDMEAVRRGIDRVLGGWGESIGALERSENEISSNLSRLHELARSLRLAPAGQVLNPMRRFAQELAHRQGKLVEVSLEGTELELDRSALHVLEEPLRRLVWFGVTQGIEDVERRQSDHKSAAGHLQVQLRKHDDHVQLVVEDDGRGIDREMIRRRAAELGWTETSGNGAELAQMLRPEFGKLSSGGDEGIDLAGMNAELRRQQGRMSVASEPGKGTTFEIRLPLDMTVVDGMVVRVGEVRYVVPVSTVRRILRPGAEDLVHSSAGASQTFVKFEDGLVPVQALGGSAEAKSGLMLVVDMEDGRLALNIDELLGRQQVLVRPLQGTLANVRDASGAAILGEGEVGIVLNREMMASTAN